MITSLRHSKENSEHLPKPEKINKSLSNWPKVFINYTQLCNGRDGAITAWLSVSVSQSPKYQMRKCIAVYLRVIPLGSTLSIRSMFPIRPAQSHIISLSVARPVYRQWWKWAYPSQQALFRTGPASPLNWKTKIRLASHINVLKVMVTLKKKILKVIIELIQCWFFAFADPSPSKRARAYVCHA